MQSAAPVDEVDYAKRRNASRPSVIYFHGLFHKDNLGDQTGASNMFFTQHNRLSTRVKNSGVEIVDIESEEKNQNDYTEELTNCEPEECVPKRHRTSFTSFQLKRLEEEFDQDAYIIGMKRWRLAEELEIPEKQIKIWFQNRRTKLKKHGSKSDQS